jgi:hypothetical protein
VILRWVVRRLSLSILLVSISLATAQAGPFADFFRELRRSFGPPPPRHAHHTASHRTNSTDATAKSHNAVDTPPNDSNTRSTRAVATSGAKKADLKYGTPVAGKPGFVTSPFSPNGGYIDVRGFQPGTEVKDPYTGKTFLTP